MQKIIHLILILVVAFFQGCSKVVIHTSGIEGIPRSNPIENRNHLEKLLKWNETLELYEEIKLSLLSNGSINEAFQIQLIDIGSSRARIRSVLNGEERSIGISEATDSSFSENYTYTLIDICMNKKDVVLKIKY